MSAYPFVNHPFFLNTIQSWTQTLCLDSQKSLNLKIYSYSVNTLAYPHHNTWHKGDGTNTQTIDHLGLIPNHRRSLENVCKKGISGL